MSRAYRPWIIHSNGDGIAVVSGETHTVPALASRVGAVVEQIDPGTERVISKPRYVPLSDHIVVDAEPDLSRVNVDSLKKRHVAFLQPLKEPNGDIVDWEWTPMLKTTKLCRRLPSKENHVTVEVKFPEGKRDRDVDLQDGKVYGADWVLLSEDKAGGREKKKRKKTKPTK